MANDPQRPHPPILKRFANLDFDGVDTPRVKPPRRSNAAPASSGPTVTTARGAQPSPPNAGNVNNGGNAGSQAQRPPSRGGFVESGLTVQPRTVASPPSRATGRRDESTSSSPLLRPQPLSGQRGAQPPSSAWGGDSDLERLARLGEELNDNARVSLQNATPEARRAQRAAELRAARPRDPRPTRPLTPEEIRAQQAQAVSREVDRIRFDLRQMSAADLELELDPDFLGATPGVRTVEMDRPSRARGFPERFGQEPLWELPRNVPPRPPGLLTEALSQGRRDPSQSRANGASPIELTPMAARQIQLMAWEAGVPGSPLRILTSPSPGLGHPEVDFAFDETIEDDDLVVDALGVTVVIDPQSLVWVRGRRITWHDVPGSEGFLLR